MAPPAWELLLEACRRGPRLDPTTPLAPPAPIDWNLLSRWAEREGVVGLLALHLHKVPWIPTRIRTHWQAQYDHQAARAWRSLFALRALLDHWKGPPLIALKGIAWIELVYRPSLGLRPMSDCDLLVPPDAWPELLGRLAKLGWRRRAGYQHFFEKGDLALDVHLTLTGEERLHSRRALYMIDMDRLFARAQPLPAWNGILYTLDPYDAFVYGAVHSLKHAFQRLIWLVDLAELIRHTPEWDWMRLYRRAQALAMLRPVLYSLLLLERWFAISIPSEVRTACCQPPLSRWERRFLALVLARTELEYSGMLIETAFFVQRAARIRYLAELCWPSAQVIDEGHPHHSYLGRLFTYGARCAWHLPRLMREGLAWLLCDTGFGESGLPKP